jgi:hypothetical protein
MVFVWRKVRDRDQTAHMRHPRLTPPADLRSFETWQDHIYVALRDPRTARGELPPKPAVQPAAVPVGQVPARQPPLGIAAVGDAGSAV